MLMPMYPTNRPNSAYSRKGEHITGSTSGCAPMGQDGLRSIALPVTIFVDEGPTPNTAASSKPYVAKSLPRPMAISSTSNWSPQSGRQERHHLLRCTMPLAPADHATTRVPAHTSRRRAAT